MDKLSIEYVKTQELKPYERNAKEHPEEQVEQIKKSIQDFGFNDPIAIWNGEVVEGHGRLIAALEMGMEEVPIIRLDGLTDEQRRAYALVHNKLTMNSGFDMELLSAELEELADFSLDDFGFDMIFIEDDGEAPPSKEIDFKESISVVVECASDSEAEEIFERLTKEGYKCRVSTL